MNNKYNGLTDKEVRINRNKYGINKIETKKKHTIFKLIIESLNDPIIKILLISLAIKILLLFKDSNIYETLGIAISVFLASFISVLSEYSSEKAFEKLNEENSLINVKVIRNGNQQIINNEELVVEDIIILSTGDKVCADGILLDGEVQVDESILTGETIEKQKNIKDRLYMGSLVCNGYGIMKVEKIAKNTYYGHIAETLQEDNNIGPLKLRLRDLAKTISIIGYVGALLVFISYMLNSCIIPNNYSNVFAHIIYALTLSVAVIVMAVPEGLPMMITLVLSSNMKKLLNKNVLVRKLTGIETSGSLNILFTDKTGTITEGKLKVKRITLSNLTEYDSLNKINNFYYDLIYQSLVYNNDSFFEGKNVSGGNITDKAILSFVGQDKKDKYNILDKKHFDSKKKYSSVTTNYNNKTIFIKGAYEVILSKCNRYLDNDNVKVLIDKDKYINYINQKTMDSERVLALAYKNEYEEKYILLGFIFLKDNIRKEAYEAIKEINNAGIQVTILSGDAKETCISIARELNMLNKNDLVITSEELNKMTKEEIKNNLSKIKIIARCLPEDKLSLIKVAQELNLVVGMTGDGVNDAPALKKADVGFSMGNATEITKESSDIIILDNNIKSISESILYGRTIFKNIRKFVTFQLSVNICAVLLSIIAPFFGILSPITVIQVLWVNMVMDTFSGLAFSYEPALKEYMQELPKTKNEKIINKYMLNQIIIDGVFSMLISLWFLTSPIIKRIYRYNISDKYLLSAFFGMFIFIDIFNAFNSRTHRINIFSNLIKNRVFLLIFIFITIVQIIFIYYGGELFRTTGLTIYEFEIMLLSSSLILIIDIIRKITLKKLKIKRGF